MCMRGLGERREMPFPLAGRRLDKAVKLRYGEKLGGTFARRAEAAVEVAAELEESAVAEIRERLVGAARDAVSEVGAERGAGERRRWCCCCCCRCCGSCCSCSCS